MLGGGGGSSSSSSQATTSQDRRQAVDSGVAVSADSSSVAVQVLDAGAISGALDVVRLALGGAEKAVATVAESGDRMQATYSAHTRDSLRDVLGFASSAFDRSLTALDRAGQVVEGAGQSIAKAYDGAKGEGDQKTYIAMAALAVVAVVAFKGK